MFRSSHFFESHTLGAKIKGPIDFSLGAIRQIPFTDYDDFNYRNKYLFWRGKHSNVSDQGQSIIDSPNVAGWPAFIKDRYIMSTDIFSYPSNENKSN